MAYVSPPDVCLQAIPPVLKATGKVKNPYPNSGVAFCRKIDFVVENFH